MTPVTIFFGLVYAVPLAVNGTIVFSKRVVEFNSSPHAGREVRGTDEAKSTGFAAATARDYHAVPHSDLAVGRGRYRSIWRGNGPEYFNIIPKLKRVK